MDSDLPGILRKSSAKLALKTLHVLKKLESSFINTEATKLVEEHSGAKASEENSETSKVTDETSETSKSKKGKGYQTMILHTFYSMCVTFLGHEKSLQNNMKNQ